ncbi:hypothetical protein [Pseudoduganella violaceinigra]|uniref:hypothetical protein n=1 Tax=Pseudoduganella violaceinigra TaxID=246602 RepID=UPI0004894025|nr:hypothetical protein [Pseudoduganella violaceinigra]
MITWTAVSSGLLPINAIQFVLAWDADRGMADIAWFEDGGWLSADGAEPINVTHWSPIIGPDGEEMIYPREDEADEVQS